MTKRFTRPVCALLALALSVGIAGCKADNQDKLTVLLNGKSVPNPATVGTLGEDYSSDYPALYYKGDVSAGVIFDDKSEEDDELKKEIKWLTASQGFTADGALSVNGIVLGSEQSEVLKAFGEPQGREDDINMWAYREDGQPEDESYLGISFDENDKVSWIGVRINR